MNSGFYGNERRGAGNSCILAIILRTRARYKGGAPRLLVGRGAALYAA
jgi:hypothetical protein